MNRIFIQVKVFLFTLLSLVIASASYATAWSTKTAGDITVLSNWWDGTTSPSSFATPGDTWTVDKSMTIPSSTAWAVGTSSGKPVTVTFDPGGTLSISGAGAKVVIDIYGDLIMNGGTLTVGGAKMYGYVNVYGNVNVNTGTFSSTGSSCVLNLTDNGNFTMTGGTSTSMASSSDITFTVNGNTSISGGDINTSGASATTSMNTHGTFSMSAGTFTAGGAGSVLTNNVYGNGAFTGTAAMKNTGAGCTSSVHYALTTGTMMIENTSTGTWSGTDVFVDASCTAQLSANFSTKTGSTSNGVTVNGTLVVPAAFVVNGTGLFLLNSSGTLVVASTTGINGAITTTGTKTFNAAANYTFNGTSAQVTGVLLPAALTTPGKITISNATGVTLSQNTATSGTLNFVAGTLSTGAFTMTTPGASSGVTGAGASSYVIGVLSKTIAGSTTITYETGDVNYAPVTLGFSSGGTAGTISVKSNNGLHPSVSSSGLLPGNMANHYWTVGSSGASGPATVTVKGTYNASDIIGGSNSAFVAQHYSGSAWLGSPISCANTSSPYSSLTASGVALASLPGDYIFGNVNCGTAPITGANSFCAKTTSTLSNATPGGAWTSGNTTIATVNSSGVVSGVKAGTVTISYTVGLCTVIYGVTVNPCATLSANNGKVSEPELKIFPNPSYGDFTVDLLSSVDEQVFVTMSDMAGRVVKQWSMSTNKETEVKVPGLQGLYLISVADGKGRYMSRLLLE